MSTIMPQSDVSGKPALNIVVRTVHGDTILVRLDQLGGLDRNAVSHELLERESPSMIRDAA